MKTLRIKLLLLTAIVFVFSACKSTEINNPNRTLEHVATALGGCTIPQTKMTLNFLKTKMKKIRLLFPKLMIH